MSGIGRTPKSGLVELSFGLDLLLYFITGKNFLHHKIYNKPRMFLNVYL